MTAVTRPCILLAIVSLGFSAVLGCYEDHLDHLMTEAPTQTPLLKIGTTCPIPDRKTTTLKNAKFIAKCQFARINYRTLGEETILLPTGDVFSKGSILKVESLKQLFFVRNQSSQ